MRHRHWAALAVAALWLIGIAAPVARAQYTQGLPPGIISVEVDGQPIDAVAVPVTNQATPEFTGRVDLGVTVIELAVAAGDVIRFAAEVDERGNFRATVPQALSDGQYSLYISDILIGAFIIEGAVPTEREPGRLLDIARVVPYPADFGEGLPGVGFVDGRFFTIEEEALRSAAGGRSAISERRRIQRRLAESGWLQRYENRLATPHPDVPGTFAVEISSFVVEYASGADARTAFAALIGEELGIEFPTVGNQSVLTLLTGSTSDTGVEYQAARLVFRLGPMLGVIVFADLRNQPPDLAMLESVSQAVAARGVVIADRQTVPLGSMTLRLDATTAAEGLVRRDLYEVRGGQITTLYDEQEPAATTQAALDAGATDVFSSATRGMFFRDAGPPAATRATPSAASPGAAATPELPPAAAASAIYAASLYAFPGDQEAGAWLLAQRDQLRGQGPSVRVVYRTLENAPRLGDDSAAFSSERPTSEGQRHGYRLYARSGPIVAILEIETSPEIPLRAAVGLMEQQLECIAAQGCAGAAALPRSAFENRAGGQDTAG